MHPTDALLSLLLAASCGAVAACEDAGDAAPPPAAEVGNATERLRAWAAGVERGVVRVSENVYAALGYTHSVNSMIVGPDGVIVVDPGNDEESSRKVRAAFERITSKPVRAIVYTHGHVDHTRGSRAFLDEGAEVAIWARENFNSELRETLLSGLRPWVRPAFTQGGDLRDDQLFLFTGHPRPPSPELLQRMMTGPGKVAGTVETVVPPTNTFAGERVSLDLAGVQLELVAAPGETEDQLYVWLPEDRVLFAGDNVSHSWPNVYSLRGSHRDYRAWIASLDRMLAEGPERLVPGHGNPVLEGAAEQLENRRDAMQWVYDRTVEGINRQMTADEVVAFVELPPRYAALDYLADYYGDLEYCVRQIYADQVGWFDGDPLELFRETPLEQSERMAALVGGEAALMDRARGALARGDARGAAQLAQHATRLRPDDPQPKLLLADALESLAEGTLNTQARYYALSFCQRLRAEAAGER